MKLLNGVDSDGRESSPNPPEERREDETSETPRLDLSDADAAAKVELIIFH